MIAFVKHPALSGHGAIARKHRFVRLISTPLSPGRQSGRHYITRVSADTTVPMLRLLMAATQMRPESTP